MAELFRSGPTRELRGALAEATGLTDLAEKSDLEVDEDEIGAVHHSMFGFNVFPHASVFLEEDGLLGKDVTAWTRAFYNQFGLFKGNAGEAADHITTELLFLSQLAGSTSPMAGDAQRLAGFCDHHLFAWLPPFVFAIERRKDPYYSQLAGKTLELVIAHRKTATIDAAGIEAGAGAEPEAETEDLSGDTPGVYCTVSTSEHQTTEHQAGEDVAAEHQPAEHFAAAQRCGMFLSRGDITDLARSLNLPTGFGGRIQMIRTLFDSSVTYEKERGLAAGFRNLCEGEIACWQKILLDHPPEALVDWSEQWIAKLETSLALLQDDFKGCFNQRQRA